MRKLKIAVPAVVLLAGLTIPVSVSFGKPEYTKKEKKGCLVCHTKANSKELNKVGECYKEKKTLEGCPAN